MTKSPDLDVPVLIVGGGGAGLTASILLSNLGVESLLVSRYPGTSQLPKAHLLNQRTMEIFTDAGVAPAILERGTPLENMHGIAWYSSLSEGPDKDWHGRVLATSEGWGQGYTDPDYIAASACATANLPLIRLEPILKAYAEKQSSESRVRFGHELLELEQDADGVTSTILDRETGQTYTVRSTYVLGADGGRTVAGLTGIGMGSLAMVKKMINVYFSADLSPYFTDPEPMIRWVFNPEHPRHLAWGCSFIGDGPDHWGQDSEEWTCSLAVDDDETLEDTEIVRAIRESLGVAELDITVHRKTEWWMETVLADRYRAGRVFLLGDAAHRHPPTGGLGLNTAIHDAANLCWKLAAVLAGRAGDSLLETYDVERRPVAAANIEVTLAAVESLVRLPAALGLSSDNSVEENWAALRLFWEDLPGSAERRHAFSEFLAAQGIEYRTHNLDYGYAYESTAIVGDGTPAPVLVDPVRLYEPGTRPGAPVPHAWVVRAGERLPLRSLVHNGHFALIAGEDGQDWVEAAEKIASTQGIPLRTARVGLKDVDLVDARLAWLKQREISAAGAVLVRPDGHIAFRSSGGVADPETALGSAFGRILATTRD